MPSHKEARSGVRLSQAFESTLQDVRYALRSFRHSPAFVLTVAATIALGLGINTALFTLFNALRSSSHTHPRSLQPLHVHVDHTRGACARVFMG